ncbi:hypothetical protein R2083_11715 [Nitrosomonas sp. Is35]|uniref:hypothetical protein n=1 Tax=Nitrosomonas sp. Is35 TaxID=3080534 RepID=UPI00294B8E40|nr:hypothetical protein [Nitrosomonas sp. Is35]MDV6348182.1 hypothetical protein [Nitrosomonas sp. Is35]
MAIKNALNEQQISDYSKSYDYTLKCLEESKRKLEKLNEDPTKINEDDFHDNETEIGELDQKIALVKSKKIAFDRNEHSINPPSTQQLDSLKGLMTKVERLTANQAIATEIVRLSTDALTEFNNIHSD